MANVDDDIVSNPSQNETFDEVVAARLSRRGFLGGGLSAAVAASVLLTIEGRAGQSFATCPIR